MWWGEKQRVGGFCIVTMVTFSLSLSLSLSASDVLSNYHLVLHPHQTTPAPSHTPGFSSVSSFNPLDFLLLRLSVGSIVFFVSYAPEDLVKETYKANGHLAAGLSLVADGVANNLWDFAVRVGRWSNKRWDTTVGYHPRRGLVFGTFNSLFSRGDEKFSGPVRLCPMLCESS